LRAGAVFLSHLLASPLPHLLILSLLFAYGRLPFPDRCGFRSILL
jgi:hypothetical protein